MKTEIIYTLMIGMGFLVIFSIAEILYHQWKLKGEITRKFVHFTAGLYSLIFPALIHTHWLILMLGISFGIILIVSKKAKLLPSIHDVERKTSGSYIYPFSVYGSFLLYTLTGQVILFYLPLMVMVVSDTAAAFAGKIWKLKFSGMVGAENNSHKTIAGTSAFIVTALFISFVLLSALTNLSPQKVLLLSLIVSSLSGAAEAVSSKGWDNLSVPLTVAIVLVLFLEI